MLSAGRVTRQAWAYFLITLLAVCLESPPAWAQEDETYDFDGMADEDPQPEDPTDWFTNENWADGPGGPDPNPAFGPPIPDFGTRVEIVTSTFGVNAPEIKAGEDAEAFEIRIGREEGAGLLTVSGGTLTTVDSCLMSPFTCNRRLRVGAGQSETPEFRNPGTMNVLDGVVTTDTLWIGSGSQGTMNVMGGVVNARGDLSIDWTFDAGSMLNVTGGTINVGTSLTRDLRMYRHGQLNLDGGEIFINGAAAFGLVGDPVSQGGTEPPDVTVNITNGLLEASGLLQLGGMVTIDGGTLRAGSFAEADSNGTIELNEGGILQFAAANETIQSVQDLITNGFITTSSPMGTAGFMIEVVDLSGTDFVQVAFAMGLAGDYNDNGVVDAADYTVYQDNLGASISLPGENSAATTPGLVDEEDYDFWVDNFGNSGAASGAGIGAATIPEPASLMLAWMMLVGIVARRHRI